jgi:RNA polymerase sigma-70 factor (ECF subfamily)
MSLPSPDRLDDAALIRRSRREPGAFAALYDRHAAPIYRFAARRLGPDAAEDILAETFLAAFRRRESYELGRPDARPWLYGIAVNEIGKRRRSEVRMWRALARTGIDPVTDGEAARSHERLVAIGARPQLASAIARLSPGDRDVLLLFAWADLSYEQIAVALGIPVGTVRSRLSRARRKMREALGGATLESITEEEPSYG